MTGLEISKALALAIGWKENQMRVGELYYSKLLLQVSDEYFAREFDYRDWNVIGPIAEKYKRFPWYDTNKLEWVVHVPSLKYVTADTPQKAIAMAVIGSVK